MPTELDRIEELSRKVRSLRRWRLAGFAANIFGLVFNAGFGITHHNRLHLALVPVSVAGLILTARLPRWLREK